MRNRRRHLRRVRQPVEQPVLCNALHPGTAQRDDLSETKQPEIAVAQGAKGLPPAAQLGGGPGVWRQAGAAVPVGFFPYAAQQYGTKLFVSKWGVTERVFADGEGTTNPATGVVTHVASPFIGGGTANLFANPVTDPSGRPA